MSSCCKESDGARKLASSRGSSQNNVHVPVEEDPHSIDTSVCGHSPSRSPEHADGVPVSEMSPVIELPRPALTRVPLIPIVFSSATKSKPSQCAYCDNPEGDMYDYFHVYFSMPYEHFEEFMENGWWRTGKLVFRPKFDVVCCPGYALRLPVERYSLTKKHRRVIRRWAEFLKKGDAQWENRGEPSASDSSYQVSKERTPPVPKKSVKRPVKPGVGPDPSKPPCRKAKERRAERLRAKKNQTPESSSTTTIPSLADFIDQEFTQVRSSLSELKHKFDVKLLPCSPMDPLLRVTIPQAYKLYDKLQRTVHPGKTRFESEAHFTQGFCYSCLNNTGDHTTPQGSFHLQYYLDHELVMYSIVDITPRYFVSVYFVYDPDLRFLSPGIFTCLYEMAMIQKLKQTLPNLQYYGLGYYNHTDDKSSYKRQFKPQEILCNETNVFVSLESAIPKFSALEGRYCRLSDDSVPEKEGRTASIDAICVSKRRLSLGPFVALSETDKERYRSSLKEFVCEAGSSAAQKCDVDLMTYFES